MDTRSQAIIDTLHPKFKLSVQTAWAEAQAAMPANVQVILIAGICTFAQSNADYAIGRTVKGEGATPALPMGQIITKAAAGQSYHNFGLAIDFAMVTDGKDDYVVGPNWMKVVVIMEKYGMTWGGNFPDGFHDDPHFENRYGYGWRQLLAKYNAEDFIPGTAFVNI